MAEAAVNGSVTPKFYCHVCNVEVQSVNTDFTCPLCAGGFVEELPPLVTQSPRNGHTQELHRDLEVIRDHITTLLMSRTGIAPALINMENNSTGSFINGRNTTRRLFNRTQTQNFDRLDNVLLEILQNISGGNEITLGSTPMLFMGNPGDYAWGREGIDTIVTQLLNQMDTSGPPPLSKDRIKLIPTVRITSTETTQKMQCSVCWDDFKLHEEVRKLPCMHIFHDTCIVPWLDLHGTCPICRKCLMPEHCDDMFNFGSVNNVRPAGDSVTSDIFSTAHNPNNIHTLQNINDYTAEMHGQPSTSHNAVEADVGHAESNASKLDDGNVEYDFD